MACDEQGKPKQDTERKAGSAAGKGRPDWAQSLGKLYDSVVNEPVPDDMMDLLSKLDDKTAGSKDG